MKRPRLFSYVVTHDHGTAPHPGKGNCVLSHCKFSKTPGRKNLLESVEIGDWIVGTGGSGNQTTPPDRIVYAMKVEEKLPIETLFKDRRFTKKTPGFWHGTQGDPAYGEVFVASFNDFYYFGKKAPKIPERFMHFRSGGRVKAESIKAQRGYKRNFTDDFAWIRTQRKGKSGDPWAPQIASSKGGCNKIECLPRKRESKRACRESI